MPYNSSIIISIIILLITIVLIIIIVCFLGFIVDLDAKRMKEGLEHAGCFMSAATTRLCPADRILYRVRDITSTVDSLPLIVCT